MTTKCPYCEKTTSRFNIKEVDVSVPFGTTWRAVAYECPKCHLAISVQIDPVALKADIVADVVEALRSS